MTRTSNIKNLYLHIGDDYAEIRAGNAKRSDTTHCIVHYPSEDQIALLRLFVAAPVLLATLERLRRIRGCTGGMKALREQIKFECDNAIAAIEED